MRPFLHRPPRRLRKVPRRGRGKRIYFFILPSLLSLILFQGCASNSASLNRRAFNRGTSASRCVPKNYDYRKYYRLNTDRLMASIHRWLGTPYCRGGSNARCVDCSGFVKNIYKETCGAKLPRSAKSQFTVGQAVRKSDLSKGDLVFFHIGSWKINHVGIYIGDGQFAHASEIAGVGIASLGDPYFRQCYAGARRLFP